ncbi:MAG: hypothetical protein GX851_04525, partial [Clostridiales bacterium]|nr:hypothetical protein [Clostridiales bacterium]
MNILNLKEAAMSAQFISGYVGVSRYILAGAGILLLVLCAAALLRYRQKPAVLAVLKNLMNGDVIPVNRYETSVGSNK